MNYYNSQKELPLWPYPRKPQRVHRIVDDSTGGGSIAANTEDETSGCSASDRDSKPNWYTRTKCMIISTRHQITTQTPSSCASGSKEDGRCHRRR